MASILAHTLGRTIHRIILATWGGHACVMEIFVVATIGKTFLLAPLAPMEKIVPVH